MAFTNYTSFVTTVESYLARTDLTSVIPDFIQMAQLRMSRDLRTEAMLKVATTTPTDSKVAFPTDFLELRVNGQWYTQRVFKLDRNGWDIPNKYRM